MRLYEGVRLLDHPSMENVLRLDQGAFPMIREMHRRGIYLNVPKLKLLETELSDREVSLQKEIDFWAGRSFNAGSPDQVAHLLFDEFHLPVPPGIPMTKSGKRPSVDDNCLAALANEHPIVNIIQDLRGMKKLRTTYVAPLPTLVKEDGRIHTTFRTTVARTGRLSSENPNLMNISVRSEDGKRVREAFEAQYDDTVLGAIDLSQIEMRTAAHLSRDAAMAEVFRLNQDIHLKTVCSIYHMDYQTTEAEWKRYKAGELTGTAYDRMKSLEANERLRMKQVGFGVLFGQTPPGLQLSILSVGGPFTPIADCERHIGQWFDVYSGIREWLEETYCRVRQHGMVWDIFGRPRLIPGVRSALSYIVGRALREAGNQPVQASAQGIIKLAMAKIMKEVVMMFQSFGEICWPLLQIHDELICELGKNITEDFLGLSKEIMETVVPLSVPVRASASIARNWKELK